MQTGKTYCYKMIQNVINTVHTDSLVNTVRQAQFKSLQKKQKRFLEHVDGKTLKRFKITTVYCELATLEGTMFLLLFF